MQDRRLIRYTRHARQQMARRSISEDDVWLTLSDPDTVVPGEHSVETIAIKQFVRRRVRVVYVSEPDEVRIITVTR